MAIDKKMLQRFLDNPANVSAEEMLDDQEEQEMPSEESQIEPEEMMESEPSEMDGEEMAEGEDMSLSDLQVPSQSQEDIDFGTLEKLKRLKAGEPMESGEDEETSADVASDMQAPTELRKKALQRIKQKYLGQ